MYLSLSTLFRCSHLLHTNVPENQQCLNIVNGCNLSRSGILDEPKCNYMEDDLHHAVLVVGYGTEKGHDYWIIKNR